MCDMASPRVQRESPELICNLPTASKYRHCMYQLTVVAKLILFTYQSIIFPVLTSQPLTQHISNSAPHAFVFRGNYLHLCFVSGSAKGEND